eukprot:5326316-Pyramimonas_sp.AAC.1
MRPNDGIVSAGFWKRYLCSFRRSDGADPRLTIQERAKRGQVLISLETSWFDFRPAPSLTPVPQLFGFAVSLLQCFSRRGRRPALSSEFEAA